MICLGLCSQFQRSKPRQAVRYTIVKPYRMLHCKRPKVDVIRPSICPMQQGVHHKATSHVHCCLNSTLVPSILMLRSNARKGLRLPFIHTLLVVFLSRENSIIAVVVFDISIGHIPKPLLKTSLAHHPLIGTKRNLIFNPNAAQFSIIINCSPLKTIFF